MVATVDMKSINDLKLLLRPVLDRFAWYHARLVAMDAAEIAHRLVEAAASRLRVRLVAAGRLLSQLVRWR